MSAESLKDTALHRISKIVDQACEESEIFREEVNKAEFMGYFSDRIENGLSPDEFISITDEELTERIRQHLAIDVLFGLLSDLTPEEMEIFDAAVEGR
jgi:hypothetical protein